MSKKTQKKAGASRRKEARRGELVLEGLGVSPGVAIGPAHVRESGEIQVLEYRVAVSKVKAEQGRFAAAVERARRQLDKLQKSAKSLHGTAAEELGYLLEAHDQMLSSSRLLKGVEKRIKDEQLNAEAAVMTEISEIAARFEAMDDPYLRSQIGRAHV